MCGINCIVQRASKSSLDSMIKKMNQKIAHRGPDENGVYLDTHLAMGMQRLSIIDLKKGSQPIYSKDQSKVIVFNGEIYNYKEIKKEIKKGNSDNLFQTASDTEVVLRLYEMYGIEGFKKLDGMFTFFIHDKTKDQLIFSRDFFGEKPLYYYKNNDSFIASSELKAIKEVINDNLTIDSESVEIFFQLTYIPAPRSIYREIKKLKANSVLILSTKTLEYKIQKLHSQNKIDEISKKMGHNTALREIRELVISSVKSRLNSDVSIASFLSGGVDSSIISYLYSSLSEKKIDTFTMAFKEKSFDESSRAKKLAKQINSNHHSIYFNQEFIENHTHDILSNFDEPFADSSSIGLDYLCKYTSSHHKVVLTGDGADEIFGGYNKYHYPKINNRYTKFIPEPFHKYLLKKNIFKSNTDNRKFIFFLDKLVNNIDYGGSGFRNIISLGFKKAELALLFKNPSKDTYFHKLFSDNQIESLNDMKIIDLNCSLEGDMLTKTDRVSMRHSLEARAPFLSRSIWEFTYNLPQDFLIKGNKKKSILKDAFEEFFPKNFFNVKKSGFQVPAGNWLRNFFSKELLSFTEKHFIEKQGIFNYDYISMIVNDHIGGRKDNSFKVWTFYCFQKWYKNNLD
jgi:asparagine synthase (glutamine-hydrolysing)